MQAAQDSAIAIEAYVQGLTEWRDMVKWVGFLGIAMLSAGYGLAAYTPLLNGVDQIIFGLGNVVYLVCTVLIYFIAERFLYRVLLGWVGTAMLVVIALWLNGLFGENAALLAADQVPIYLAVVPSVIVFAHSYLAPRHAQQLSVMYCVVLGVAAVVYLWLHWPTMATGGGPLYVALSVLVLNPVIMGLMNIHHANYRNFAAKFGELKAQTVRAQRLQQRRQHSDPITQLLNQQGLWQIIEEYTLTSEDSSWHTLAIEPLNAPQLQAMNQADRESLQLQIANALRAALLPVAELAHNASWSFFALATEPGKAWDPALLRDLRETLNQLQDNKGRQLVFHFGIAAARSGDEPAFVVEEADFQRYLAESRDLPWVYSPLLPSEPS